MRLSASVVIIVLAFACLCGCSSSNTGGTTASFSGKWTVMLDPGNEVPSAPEIDFNLMRSGDTISSDSGNTVDDLECVPPEEVLNNISSGSVKGDQFMLGVAIDNGTSNAQGVRLMGTVGKDHSSVTGTYESDPGPCFGGKTGTFIATFIVPVTGTYVGTLVNMSNAATSNATAMLSEDDSFESGSFRESASITVTNNTCFSSLASSLTSAGFSIGRLVGFETTDGAGANRIDFSGAVDAFANSFAGQWFATQGCTDQNGTFQLGVMNSSAMPATAALPAITSMEKPSQVLIQRFKLLLARRQRD
jgi:hypothetical protein